ncbi:SET_domain [Hexamita inflata]|uniref:SET_domain n=1 Tax=Hexamita inflata TaxID=28002 RepID=A0ABP1HYY3_9EUKA
MPTVCQRGDCDESSDNWMKFSPLHKECKVDMDETNLISTCKNHLITTLMYNNQMHFQGYNIKIQNSINKFIGKGAFARNNLSVGQIIAVYNGVYSLKSQRLFSTGFSAGVKVCSELQKIINEESDCVNDVIIINAQWNHCLAKYINSSCFSQSCHFIQTFVQGIPHIAVALTQDIKQNTELYIDYGADMLKIFGECQCQQYNCRIPKYPYIVSIDNFKYIEQISEFNLFYLSKLQNLVTNTYKSNKLYQDTKSIQIIMKLMNQLQRLSLSSNQITIYNKTRYDIQHPDIKLTKTSTTFSSDLETQQAKLYQLEISCIKEKQQIIQNLGYVVLPFRLSLLDSYDINTNKLVVYITQYPNSRCYKKYNTIEYSLLFNILSLKCQIRTPYYFTYQTISSQQFLINLVRFVQMSVTECQLVVNYFYDTVITQCINEYLKELASYSYFTEAFFKLQSRQTYNHKLIEPIYLPALRQAQQLVQKIIKPSILEQLQYYNYYTYSEEEYVSSILQFKHQQSEIQFKWSYINENKYLNDFDVNDKYLKVIEYFVKNPLQQNTVIFQLQQIISVQQLDKLIQKFESPGKSCR